jgi:DNA-binding transcriptional ArsR family regulator
MATVASRLAEHVRFRLTSVDRIFVAGYVPALMTEGQVVRFLLHRGYPIPSPAGLGHNHDRVVREIEQFIAATDIPVVRFAKRQSKEEVARPYLAAAEHQGREGVVLVGVAQERVAGWRGWKDGGSAGHPHFTYRRQALFVNHYYFYGWDRDWGPAFLKLCPYAPYPIWVWCNGHQWAKRQLAAAGIGFTALDNGLREVADQASAEGVCDRLGAGHLRVFIERWLARLPSPFTAEDAAAGFGYDFSVRQLEVSDTAVFDRPQAGRAFIEAAIREHLDLGRPEQVRLVVDRRITARTPGRFGTRVITPDVDPHLQIHYRSSKVKAYLKEHRALRVETTINDPRDFGVGRRLNGHNWWALRQIGVATNARFLAALGEGAPPPPDATTLEQVVLPSCRDGLRAPGLRFGDPRVMALLAALAALCHVPGGLTNAGLCRLMTGLLGRDYSARQATYDLRRLRRKGLIERLEGRQVYLVTPYDRAIACFLTKVAARVVVPVLTELELSARPRAPAPRPLISAWRAYEREVHALIAASGIAT